jgi:hypothetical protein
MSQAEQIMIGVRRSEQIERWEEARQAIADARGVDPDELSRPDVLSELLETYELHRLKRDKRIQDAREHVADDHGVDPSDVSLSCLLKITAGAYNGFQQTSDWEIEENHE